MFEQLSDIGYCSAARTTNTQIAQITCVKSQLKKSKSKTVIDLFCWFAQFGNVTFFYSGSNINYYMKSTIGQRVFGREITYGMYVFFIKMLIFYTFCVHFEVRNRLLF